MGSIIAALVSFWNSIKSAIEENWNKLSSFLTDIFNAVGDSVKEYWDDAIKFFEDLPIKIFEGFLGVIASAIEAIPVPSFAAGGGLQSALNSISPDILYFLSQSGVSQGMAILGAAMAFRLGRKLLTLGQW